MKRERIGNETTIALLYLSYPFWRHSLCVGNIWDRYRNHCPMGSFDPCCYLAVGSFRLSLAESDAPGEEKCAYSVFG